MKIRDPFQDNYSFRWKDDVSNKEKFIWSMIITSIGILIIIIMTKSESTGYGILDD